MRSYFRETIDGFIFWSFFQGLAPMIWFYPLNDLEISGYEAFAVFWFFPLICGIPGVLPILQNKWATLLLKIITVICLVSFQAPTTLTRLVILATGSGVSMVTFTTSLSHPDENVRQSYFRSLIFGFFVMLTSRVWFTTFIPSWWSKESNSGVIALGVISVLDCALSQTPENIVKTSSQNVRPAQKFCMNWLFVGAGTGSLLFATHWCFGEVSVITRWVVRGYPEHGPEPLPYGAIVLLALLAGIFISEYINLVNSYMWWLFGVISFIMLYHFPSWIGFDGGLNLAAFIMSIWPKFINAFSKCPPARTAFVTMLIYIAEVLFSVWTVAYNFVPGGVYTRERTDILIGIVLFCILLLFITDRTTTDPPQFVGANQKKSYKVWLLLIGVIGILGIGHRTVKFTQKMSVQRNTTNQFSSAIWTYHFGYDNRGWPSLERSAKFLNETGADVITLLESDASKTFLGNNDLGTWLGERLGMYVDFGPSTQDHTWGNLILSKYPIVKSVHHLLPSPHGELAPAITATINISDKEVDFVVVHMGNDRDVLDRKLQTEFLARELNSTENPVVFMGYVTSAPNSWNYKYLIKSGKVKDIDKTDQERWCEYIMYRDLIRLGYARISHGQLSDTELQMAKFEIPKNPKNYKDHDVMTINPGLPSKTILFNSYFGSHYPSHSYSKTHKYQMDTPKYFLSKR